MTDICLFTKNARLLQKWDALLSKMYNTKFYTEFEDLKKYTKENDIVVLHDDRDQELIIQELDLLHGISSKRTTFVLRSKPTVDDGEIFLSHAIGGYGNANMSDDVLLQAIEVIQSGKVWLYPDFMAHVTNKG